VRVKCTRIQLIGEPGGGREVENHHSVTRGREYLVLAAFAEPLRTALPLGLQILDDAGHPSWWPASMFATTSTVIPPNWIANVDEEGDLHLGPAAWIVRGFWEAFFDGEPEAVEIYKREFAIIEAGDPRPYDSERRKVVFRETI
jgi:hypothetical protein